MKRVFSVGLDLPGNAADYVPFHSDRALFDADIIIFTPNFDEYGVVRTYRGLPVISESGSVDLVRDCRHWKSELQASVDAGKVVFVMLHKPAQVCCYTGEETYSGTGRNRLTTQHVDFRSCTMPFRFL